MIDTSESSQVQGTVWNISYACFIPLDIMSHLDLSKGGVGVLLMVVKYH
jgi:hypothetical protein